MGHVPDFVVDLIMVCVCVFAAVIPPHGGLTRWLDMFLWILAGFNSVLLVVHLLNYVMS